MHQEKSNESRHSSKLFRRAGTKIYFRKDTERKFFLYFDAHHVVFGRCFENRLF